MDLYKEYAPNATLLVQVALTLRISVLLVMAQMANHGCLILIVIPTAQKEQHLIMIRLSVKVAQQVAKYVTKMIQLCANYVKTHYLSSTENVWCLVHQGTLKTWPGQHALKAIFLIFQ